MTRPSRPHVPSGSESEACPSAAQCADRTLCPGPCRLAGNREGNHPLPVNPTTAELRRLNRPRPAARPERGGGVKSGPCVCCGRTARGGIRVDSGLIHMDCYVEHHCGPDIPWPPDHRCGVGDPSGGAA